MGLAGEAHLDGGAVDNTLIDTLIVWAFAALQLVVPQYIETLF